MEFNSQVCKLSFEALDQEFEFEFPRDQEKSIKIGYPLFFLWDGV